MSILDRVKRLEKRMPRREQRMVFIMQKDGEDEWSVGDKVFTSYDEAEAEAVGDDDGDHVLVICATDYSPT
jgi:enoyl reductase-like protein